MSSDIIIIGSGLGGLECAHILSRQGYRVTVLERQAQPGGCMQSYRRGDYRFDTGLHYVGALGEGQSLHEAFRSLGLLRLPWHRLDPSGFDLVCIDGTTYPFAEGFDAFADTLAQHFPHEHKSLRQYAQMLQTADLESTIGINAWQYLHQLFGDELLINVLSGTSLKQELRPDSLPLFSFAHLCSGFIESSWRLEGDGSLIVNALTDDIRSMGGEVICGAEVAELVEQDGHIAEARCQDGTTHTARAFICDIHPAVMLSLIREGGKIRQTYRRRIRSLQNTTGMFTASLLLRPDAIPYFNHNLYVYRRPNVWQLHEEAGRGHVGGVMVSCRVPEGGQRFARQVDLLTPMPWSLCQPHADGGRPGHRSQAYVALKQQFASQCIDMAETMLPGLAAAIIQCHTSTPLTYRDYNNSPEGTAYGIRKDFANPLLTVLSPQTPVSNLFLTGQNVALHGLQGVTMTALSTCQLIQNTLKPQTIWKTT
jgi:phytoene dehydrogenase-like protein